MIRQFRTPHGDIVIVQGECQIAVAYEKGWQPIEDKAPSKDYSVEPAGLIALDRDEFGVDYTSIIAGAFKRRASTAQFTIDPKTGHIITEE